MATSSRDLPPTSPPVRFEVVSRSAHGAPATLAIRNHPAVVAIVVSRDLGDARSGAATLRGVPCLLLDFVAPVAAAEALERLRAISRRLTDLETPTRIASASGLAFTLRLVRGFDEATIAAIDSCYAEAVARYEEAQAMSRPQSHRGRR